MRRTVVEPAESDIGAIEETVAFLDYFKELPDPRQAGKVIYPLAEVLLLCLLAVLAGAESFVDIARFGEKKIEFLRRFRPFHHGTPAHDHLGDIFAVLDAERFQRCFVDWVAALTGAPKEVVAIDGKTLRRSGEKKSAKAAIHMVSAFAAPGDISSGHQIGAEVDDERAFAGDHPLEREALVKAGAGGLDQPLLCELLLDQLGSGSAATNAIKGRRGDQNAVLTLLAGDDPRQRADVARHFADLNEPVAMTLAIITKAGQGIGSQPVLLASDERDVVVLAGQQGVPDGRAIKGQDLQFGGEAKGGVDGTELAAQPLKLRIELRLVGTSAGDIKVDASLDKAPNPLTIDRTFLDKGPDKAAGNPTVIISNDRLHMCDELADAGEAAEIIKHPMASFRRRHVN